MKFETAEEFLKLANAELESAREEGMRDVSFAFAAAAEDDKARKELEDAIEHYK